MQKTSRRSSAGRTSRGKPPVNTVRGPLAHAAIVLGEVLSFAHPADAVLSRYFRENRALGHRDRGFVAESVYGILRRLRWLRGLCGEDASPRALLLAWLSRGEGWSARQFEGLASPQELEWIATLKAVEVPQETLAERADMPDWLAAKLTETLPAEDILALAEGLNRAAPLDLRVNIARISRDEVIADLRSDGIAAAPCPYSPHGIRLESKPALQNHKRFLDGSFEVQDEGSQLLGFLMQPRRRELVVDFCAGAGGKTLHLGAMMRSTGRLYAFDVSERRLANLKPRAARAGLSNVHPALIAHERDTRVKRLSGKADRVLVDVPCSGLGTLRRNPDLKWRQSPASIEEMTMLQSRILAAAASLVRPGGRLVYATCSLLRHENDAIVDAFALTHPEFRQVDAGELLKKQGIDLEMGARLQLLPHVHDTDGFFATVFERVDAPAV